MAKVLSISSQVVYGHVGNSVTGFVLQRLGHEILNLPTVLLSNRPGYSAISKLPIDPAALEAMLQAVAANRQLDSVDAILTGYLPSVAHVEFSADCVGRLKSRRPELIYLCDPILGDEPAGIYIDENAARGVRDVLVKQADIVTPNCFELGWLSGQGIGTSAEAVAAAQSLGPRSVIVTSAPAAAPDLLANILVESEHVISTSIARRTVLAHGTGDFFASILLAHILNGAGTGKALRAATLAMDAVLEASDGLPELALVSTQAIWAEPNSV